MKRPERVNVLLAIAVFIAFPGALELLCRSLGLGERREIAEYIADWRGLIREGKFARFAAGPGINKDGFQDRDHEVENRAGRTRIAILGDSVMFGYGVRTDQSFPVILDRLLAEAGREVEIFDISFPGWSTRQERFAYEQVVRPYAPDVVLLGFCLNDVAEHQNNLNPPPRLLATAFRHSYLIRALLDPARWEVDRIEQLFEQPLSPAIESGWKITLDELGRLADLVEADGAVFSLLIFPFRFQLEPDAPEPMPQRRLARFSSEMGIRHLDSIGALRPIQGRAFIDHDHLTELGAEWAARAAIRAGLLDVEPGAGSALGPHREDPLVTPNQRVEQ